MPRKKKPPKKKKFNRTKLKSLELDVMLVVLHNSLPRGASLSNQQIAELCGVTKATIEGVVRKAINKMHSALVTKIQTDPRVRRIIDDYADTIDPSRKAIPRCQKGAKHSSL